MTRWHLLEFSIFAAFVASNIQWHWTSNNLAAGVMGGMAAYYISGVWQGLLRRRASRDFD